MPSLRRATGTPGTADPIEYGELTHMVFEFDDSKTEILNAPDDTDWSRWGMLSDRKYLRLYFFQKGSNTNLYQFIQQADGFYYDPAYGHLTITGIPDEADPSRIGMLSTPNFETEKVDGTRVGTFADPNRDLPVPNNYHVYMIDTPEVQAAREPADRRLYQFIWRKDHGAEEGTYIDTKEMEHNGITNDQFVIKPFPEDANVDWTRWTMNYDSNRYQLMLRAYVLTIFKQGSNTEMLQARFNNIPGDVDENGKTRGAYQYSGTAELKGAPDGINYDHFTTVFDGVKTGLYFLEV